MLAQSALFVQRTAPKRLYIEIVMGDDHVHEEDLELLALDRLDPPRADVARSHVLKCPACARRVNDALAFAKRLAQLNAQQATDGPSTKH